MDPPGESKRCCANSATQETRMRTLPSCCSAYFGDFYKRKRVLGKKPNIAILATARLMARITWQLLTQAGVTRALLRPNTSEASLPSGLHARSAWPRKCRNRSKILPISLEEDFPQSLQNNTGWSLSRTL
jgi:hypothetical protein